MSTSTWTGADGADWADPDNWSPAGAPGASSDVTIAAAEAIASASIGTVNSIDDSGSLRFRSAGTNSVATFLDISGGLRVDRDGGDGGTILNVVGALTNSGSLRIGNSTLSGSDEVTAASIDNLGGGIRLLGSGASQALLDVTGSAGFGAAGTLSGLVRLAGDSAIEFASGEITGLAGNLTLNGNEAFIEDSTALGSNSALTGLASIGRRATFDLENGASVSTTGALANDEALDLDIGAGDGGSSLSIGGTLTNSISSLGGALRVGNASLSASDEVTAASLDNTGSIFLIGSATNQALLNVTGSAGFGAAGVLSGNVQLAGDSAVEFASGQITCLAASAQLHINGADAFIEDSTAPGSNTALSGLASIGLNAWFDLENKAAVSTTGALVNDGELLLDATPGVGGSNLTLAGALTNDAGGFVLMGNSSLSTSDEMTAASLDNAGEIFLGTPFGANQSLLDVSDAAGFGAAGVLSGYVGLDGDSAIEFASGQITSVAGSLVLVGVDAIVEDSTALGSNSALRELASIGFGGSLDLESGALLSTTGALVNDGQILLEVSGGDAGKGGSSLTVAGTLTNTGNLDIGIGTKYGPSSSDSVTANSFVNSGKVDLIGNGTNLEALDVSRATTNNGAISLAIGTAALAGAVAARGPSASRRPLFSLARAFRPHRPSTRPAPPRSSSSSRSPSPRQSAVSAPATQSTRRTFSCPRRPSTSRKIQGGRAGRSPCMTRARV